MSTIKDRILEGKYLYYADGKSYAQEEFSLTIESGTGALIFEIEIIARLASGQLLKTNISAYYSSHFVPIRVHIEKRAGEQHFIEEYRIDQKNNMLHYHYNNDHFDHRSEKGWASKHVLSLPCFALSTSFLLTRKLDPNAPTGIFVVRSPNDFEFTGPLEDNMLYAELKASEELQKNKNLFSSLVFIYSEVVDNKNTPDPTIYKISKLYFLPIEMKSPNQIKIECTHFQKLGSLKEN
jgi:hypothetical protein